MNNLFKLGKNVYDYKLIFSAKQQELLEILVFFVDLSHMMNIFQSGVYFVGKLMYVCLLVK